MSCSPELLTQHPLFKTLSELERATLAERIDVRDLVPGEAICREASSATTWFLLIDGRARVSCTRPDGGQELIAWLEPEAIFGTVGVLDGLPRPATVAALQPSRCLVIPRTLLEVPEMDRLGLCLRELLCRALNDQLRAVNQCLLIRARRTQGVTEPAGGRTFGGWRVPEEAW